jgi:hypothetical protein
VLPKLNAMTVVLTGEILKSCSPQIVFYININNARSTPYSVLEMAVLSSDNK